MEASVTRTCATTPGFSDQGVRLPCVSDREEECKGECAHVTESSILETWRIVLKESLDCVVFDVFVSCVARTVETSRVDHGL
jgi:hypothetical protein